MKIPYAFLPPKVMSKWSKFFLNLAKKLMPLFPLLKIQLKQADIRESNEEYLAGCLLASSFFFLLITIVFTFFLVSFKSEKAIFLGIIISSIITVFVFVQQIYYPQMILKKKIREIEQNLIPALQNILVQLRSGVPIFNVITNIAGSNYGLLSKEFEKAVRDINAGREQISALEEMVTNNPSILFRRAIWQFVSGMRAGADIGDVMEEIIDSLSEQQIIQIQNYGGQLNPLAMFYMLVAVIVPSLSVTFIILLSSFIAVPPATTKLIFWGLLTFVIFLQIMFLGIIKSKRPNLLIS